MKGLLAVCALFALTFAQDEVPTLQGSTDKPITCKGNKGNNIEQFWDPVTKDKGTKLRTDFPCKYWALQKQKCGKYEINLAPGQRFVFPKYFPDSLWVAVKNTENNNVYEGRVTNKKAAKFYNTDSTTERKLFETKAGDDSEFEFTRDNTNHWVCMQDKGSPNPSFRICFSPWEPDARHGDDKVEWMTSSDWKFECFEPNTEMDVPMPDQFCGNGYNQVKVLRKLEEYNLKNYQVEVMLFHNIFNNPEIVQTNPSCVAATETYANCDPAKQIEVMKTCSHILSKKAITKCVARHVCDPMDIFNTCLEWGCKYDFQEVEESNFLCNKTASALDFCVYHEGLTQIVENVKCYKGFISLDPEISEYHN